MPIQELISGPNSARDDVQQTAFTYDVKTCPNQLGGKVGGPNCLRTRDDASGVQNIIWGMPWISNEGFSPLAYCIGDRSSGEAGCLLWDTPSYTFGHTVVYGSYTGS